MDNAFAFGDIWLSELRVQNLYGVGEQKVLGDAVENVKIAVVIQSGSDVEGLAAAEVPGFLNVRLVVNDH